MHLDESEVFIALVFKDFGKESNFVFFFDVCLDTVDDCSGPFDNEGLQTVLLIKVCVHILL